MNQKTIIAKQDGKDVRVTIEDGYATSIPAAWLENAMAAGTFHVASSPTRTGIGMIRMSFSPNIWWEKNGEPGQRVAPLLDGVGYDAILKCSLVKVEDISQ